MLSRRNLILSGLGSLAVPGVGAQGVYPQKTLSFVVPWGAGGSNDIMARALQGILADQGFSVIVENVPGGAGSIGLTRVANAAADGYTIGMGTSSTLAFMSLGKTALKNEQFDHLVRVSVDPLLLVVSARGPHRTLEDFVAHMKAKPGGVSIGASGDLNPTHVLAAMTARSVGAPYIYVPYAGGTKILADLMGEHLEAAVLKPSDCKAQLDAGTLRPLGVYANERLAQLPEVPTFKERGHDVFAFGPVVQMGYIVAPAGLAPAVRRRLTEALGKALQDERFRKLADQNAFIVDGLSGEALAGEVGRVGNAIRDIAARAIR